MAAVKPETRVLKKKRWLRVYEKTNSISAACDSAGIVRSTYWRWFKSDSEFAELVVNIEERLLDEVEGQLIDMARGGNLQAIKVYLKAKAANRGYVPKLQISQSERLEKIDTKRLEVVLSDPEQSLMVEHVATRILTGPTEPQKGDLEDGDR